MITYAYLNVNQAGKQLFCILSWLAFLVSFTNLRLAAYNNTSSVTEEIIFQQDSFSSVDSGENSGWTSRSARESARPHFFIAAFPSLGGSGSLGISGESNLAGHGCWRRTIDGLAGGRFYRFEASYRISRVSYPLQQTRVRLRWLGADGKSTGRPDYVPEKESNEQWRLVSGTFKAPEGTSSVEIELYLCYAPQGTVWWDNIILLQASPPPARMVRVATVNCFPRNKKTAGESVEEFLPLLDDAGSRGCDIVCLGETINYAGFEKASYSDVAESIPGPSTQILGEYAAKYSMYIVTSLVESEARAIYNTAVLINRQGQVAGKYRKVYLSVPEFEEGITPGDSFPVFETDFGRIGMMVCWDMQFVEPARTLALKGAEIILMPIWGGSALLPQARAYENQIYLVSSAYGPIPSAIFNPEGKIIAEAKDRPSVAFSDIDLNKPVVYPWMGNLRNRLARERRLDIRINNIELK